MIVDILLLIVSLGGFLFLWYRVSKKIPELIAVPDQVITQRLHEDSAELRLFVLHFKSFFKDGIYKIVFWNFAEKTFYKLHIFLLRVDNWVVSLLKSIRQREGVAKEEEVRQYVEKESMPVSMPSVTTRIKEVRAKVN